MRYRWTYTVIIIAATLLMATGCASTKKVASETSTERIATDTTETRITRTDTVRQRDTVLVRQSSQLEVKQRKTEIEVPVPQAQLERETTDTTSTLETPYYTSTATWHNGRLTHTLTAKPGARIHGEVTVNDTTRQSSTIERRGTHIDTKSSKDSTANTRQRGTASTSTTITKQSKPGWWQRTKDAAKLLAGIAIAAALLYFILRAAAFFKRNS